MAIRKVHIFLLKKKHLNIPRGKGRAKKSIHIFGESKNFGEIFLGKN